MRTIAATARRIGRSTGRALVTIDKKVPPGLRTLFGILLVAGGVLGFLPILGFWMIPLGLAVIGLDVSAIWRVWKGRKNN